MEIATPLCWPCWRGSWSSWLVVAHLYSCAPCYSIFISQKWGRRASPTSSSSSSSFLQSPGGTLAAGKGGSRDLGGGGASVCACFDDVDEHEKEETMSCSPFRYWGCTISIVCALLLSAIDATQARVVVLRTTIPRPLCKCNLLPLEE